MAGRSHSRWPRSWCPARFSSRYSTPSRRCVRRRRHDVEGECPDRPTELSTGEVRPDAGREAGIDVRTGSVSRATGILGRSGCCRSSRARSSTVIVHPRRSDGPSTWEMSIPHPPRQPRVSVGYTTGDAKSAEDWLMLPVTEPPVTAIRIGGTSLQHCKDTGMNVKSGCRKRGDEKMKLNAI